ncbi:Gamma-glutamylputrescine synthetase PuuA [Dickeya aquatica]|uniref:Gamma-glutamylputrescine synthetase PuuA n=2 Tax=Pectobacteriaceae TaxID=1903410 RepID=A0A375A6C4_9GAMM|nr:Gamma-glutamylputrescine synthetase PuuA [Dickeya aquatica]
MHFSSCAKNNASSSLNKGVTNLLNASLQSDFHREVRHYLMRYPETKHVDIYLNDVNGIFRGKRISVDALLAVANGCYFPQSIYAMNGDGHVVCHDPVFSDEPDRLCLPVIGTLRPCAYGSKDNAQLLLSMRDAKGDLYSLEPRAILEKIVGKLQRYGFYPVIAPEIEFYLIDKQSPARPQLGCFHMAVPSRHGPFIEKLENIAEEQHIALAGIVSEAEPGQYELNLPHSHHVVDICERVLALRRLTGIVASEFGYQANFMAKPFSHVSGSGLHFHISLNDAQGNNVFNSQNNKLNTIMKRGIAGLLNMMPASMAIVAPHVNSFRRIRKNLNEPIFNSWGYNNRRAALRIPCSDSNSRRIEYRLAGADANPYLVMATILSGILYGLENMPEDSLNEAMMVIPDLPLFQQHAIEVFEQNSYLTKSLGDEFSRQWVCCKRSELDAFERKVTQEESAMFFEN